MTDLNSICFACGGEFHKQLDAKDHFLTQEIFEILCCESCGLRKTHPMPSPEEIGRYYETTDYLSHGDDQKGFFAWLYRQAKRRNLSRKARLLNQLSPKSELLDYGCGTGDFINYCQELGHDVRGVEPSATALSHAPPLVIHKILSPEEELESGRRYDLITMWHVLEHIHRPHEILNRLKNKLKPGGSLIIAVPNPDSTDARIYGSSWAGWDVPRHLWHFDPPAMSTMMSTLGFIHRATYPMWFDAFYVSLLSERYRKGFAPMAIIWGGISNLRALFAKKRKCSSQIYVYKAD